MSLVKERIFPIVNPFVSIGILWYFAFKSQTVKNKDLLPCLIFFTIIAVSCKKEKDPTIIGQWVSVSNYTEENGSFNWRPTNGFSQLITFNSDARFSTFIDIPTGSGTYAYNNRAAKIDLNYEADHYGTISATVTYQIDELTNDRLMVSSFSAVGNLQFRTEYARHD